MKFNISTKKITNFALTAIVGGVVLCSTSCKKLDEKNINADQKAIEYGPYVTGNYLTFMMQSIIKSNPEWKAQVQQNLNADIYSGYMMSKTPFAGGINNTNYFMVHGWNNFTTNTAIGDVLNQWYDLKRREADTKDKDLYGIALILKVTAAHRLADAFGPIPYTNFGKDVYVEYDNLETLYNAFFADLDVAVANLEEVEKTTPNFDQGRFSQYDVSTFKGDYKKWVQYANTLRLRLAMRVSGVKPSLAKAQAEKACTHAFGLLEEPFSVNCGGKHYLATVSLGWGDISLGAPLASYLNGYKDPRAAVYATPGTGTNAAVNGKIVGIRNGIDVTQGTYADFSHVNFKASDLVLIMAGAESFFLRAEGKVNGWNVGPLTAKDYYENGITQSFKEHGITSNVASYLNDNTSKPTPYVDPYNSGNNFANVSSITIKWDDAATADVKLERIITQKWLAMFPEGQEAWSEQRRTHYPVLFPVVVNNSGETLDPNFKFIRRLKYPTAFISTNTKGYSSAMSDVKGGDNITARLWWDVK